MQKTLVICDNHPYNESDKIWHGLRVAKFSADEGHTAKVFLISDSVFLAHNDIEDTSSEYELDTLLSKLISLDIDVAACGTCLGMRGLDESNLKSGVSPGTMKLLIEWISWADNVVNF